MTQVPGVEMTDTSRRTLLAAAGVLLAASGAAGIGGANAQSAGQVTASASGTGPRLLSLPPAIYEGSVKRAQKYLADKQAYADYQQRIAKMLDGFKAGQDPDPLIREVVLSDEDARAKLAPYVGVAGAEGVFRLCMLTVLATLATGQR